MRLLIGCALAGMAWGALAHPATQRADVRTGDTLRRLGAGGTAIDGAVSATTDLGSLYSVVGASATLLALGRRDAAADVAGVGALAWGISQAAKTRVRRVRPYENEGVRRLVRPPTGSSFPSGHAAVAAATTEVLAARAGPTGAALLRGLGYYVAASRVYVGVHYPSDVLGGFGGGLALGALWRAGREEPLGRAGRRVVGAVAGAGASVVSRGRSSRAGRDAPGGTRPRTGEAGSCRRATPSS